MNLVANSHYEEVLYNLNEQRRIDIIKKQSNDTTAFQSAGSVITHNAATDPKKNTNSNQQNQQAPKVMVYQQKPKVLLISDFAPTKKENTYIKNLINNNISLIVEQYSPRTPYLNQKYNDKMGAFMQSLSECLKDSGRLKQEIANYLFENPRAAQGQIYEHYNLSPQDQEGFMCHQVRKQIFCLGDVIDEITDSFYQNTIFVMDNYNMKQFNPAVLSVSYANMKVLEKSQAVAELPRVTFIQLGLVEQAQNKNFLYFNANATDKKQKKESMSNIQYISMFHQSEQKPKQNLSDQEQQQQQQEENDFGSWDSNTQTPNSFEIAMNAFIEEKKQAGDDSSLNDLFFKKNYKCPKIIGSSEFLYLFEQVLKLIRHHRPQIILFAYDFSLTKAHNHYYDLKPDILGYFSYMLSQISNHHVIFIANTKCENHFIPEQLQINLKERQYYSLDGFQNFNNYETQGIVDRNALVKLHEQNQYAKQSTTTFLQNMDKATNQNKGPYPIISGEEQTGSVSTSQPQVDESTKKQQNQEMQAIDQKTKTAQSQVDQQHINVFPLLSQAKKVALSEMPDTYFSADVNSDSLNLDGKQGYSLSKYFQSIITDDKQSKISVDYFKFNQEKFSPYDEEPGLQYVEAYLAYQKLRSNQNFYSHVSEQFHSIFFGLLEVINYRKIILKENQKTGNHVEKDFMINLTRQIRRTVVPSKQHVNKEILKPPREKLQWQLNHIKIHDYMTKIKQIKHIVDFVSYSNNTKVQLLQSASIQHYYTCNPEGDNPTVRQEIEANSKSQIYNVRLLSSQLINERIKKEQITKEEIDQVSTATLIDGISRDVCNILFSDQLKVKIMLKRYTQSLLNNWVYDIRRKQKVYLNVIAKDQNVNGDVKFFSTERSQHIIDYKWNDVKIIIYFFNVQRGKVFKNFILTEHSQNLFIIEEIVNSIPIVSDMLWKSFIGVPNLSTISKISGELGKGEITNSSNKNMILGPNAITNLVMQKDYATQQQKTGQDEQKEQTEKIANFYIHQEKLENLEIFNSTLCICEKFVVRMFGEVIRSTKWKQKEFSMMIFTIPRKQDQENWSPIQNLVNVMQDQDNYIYKSIPRSGCTSVSVKHDKTDINEIYVFGGTSYNGFLCNIVEIYQFTNDGQLIQKEQRPKQLNQKIFRPLFSPFTFLYKNNIYFFGGEFGKKFVSRALNQVYIQQYSIEDKKFNVVHTMSVKDINTQVILKGMEQKKHQRYFLEHCKKITFYSTNHNQYQIDDDNFTFAMTGQVHSAIEQILEKSTIININIQKIIEWLAQNVKQPSAQQGQQAPTQVQQDKKGSKVEKYVTIEVSLEDEKQQELRLNDYNSSTTFFISSFQADQSTYLPQQQSQQQQLQQQSQQLHTNANTRQVGSIQQQQAQSDDKTNKAQQTQPNYSESRQISNGNAETDSKAQKKGEPEKTNVRNDNMAEKNAQTRTNADFVDQINEMSNQTKFDFHADIADSHQSTANTPYTIQVRKDIYNSYEDKIFTPKYFLCQNYLNKLVNIIIGDLTNQPQLTQKFQLTIRFADEDFKDALLSNQMHFLTYYANMNQEKKVMNFYKTLSLEECTELSQMFGSRISFKNSLYKAQVKFDQQRISVLALQQFFDDDFEFISPSLVNRYITCDQNFIYLINGTELESHNQYNKLSPCERISIKDKRAERINPCIFLDSKKSQILSNDSYIFYIGLYEPQDSMDQENGDEEDEEEDEDESSEQLIAQIFSKKEKLWRVIRLDKHCKEIKKNFQNYQLLLGNGENKVFAIKNQFQKNKRDFMVNYEMGFDLTKLTCIVKVNHLQYSWQGHTKIQVIPSLFYSGTVYTALPTNPAFTYQVTSMIPVVRN